MTFNQQTSPPTECFVWIWLNDAEDPMVVGRLETSENQYLFNYGQRYLESSEKNSRYIPIFLPELPLEKGQLHLLNGLSMPNCLRDASPEAWGRRVLLNRMFGKQSKSIDPIALDELTYLLESGSDRIGALDFQRSPTQYIPRLSSNQELEQIIDSVKRVEEGLPLSPELDLALFHGTSVGGVRPKALIDWKERKFIAKFSSNTEIYIVS